MINSIRLFFDGAVFGIKTRLIAIFSVLAILNVGAWIWALLAFHNRPALLGTTLLVYGLGLRHAVDADHIAAIDNVTRKLTQMNLRPVSLGFFFAWGHSAVVILVAAAVAGAATMLETLRGLQQVAAVFGTSVSVAFLLAVALMNSAILWSLIEKRRYKSTDETPHVFSGGLAGRFLRPLFSLVTKSWHMLPLGFLFGLGFDTATEVTTFAVSAAQAAKGVPFGAIMVFPVLFAAGMSLVDTIDGVVMLGAYEWAFVNRSRRLRYNIAITLASVVAAVMIALIEVLGLLGDQFALKNGIWNIIGSLNGNFDKLGFAIAAAFGAIWITSYILYRLRTSSEASVLGSRVP